MYFSGGFRGSCGWCGLTDWKHREISDASFRGPCLIGLSIKALIEEGNMTMEEIEECIRVS